MNGHSRSRGNPRWRRGASSNRMTISPGPTVFQRRRAPVIEHVRVEIFGVVRLTRCSRASPFAARAVELGPGAFHLFRAPAPGHEASVAVDPVIGEVENRGDAGKPVTAHGERVRVVRSAGSCGPDDFQKDCSVQLD